MRHHELVRLRLLCLLCLLLCSACTLPFRVFENTRYPSPPQYPQAHHWEVQKVRSRYDDRLRIIHFQTQDDVDTVYQFFATSLGEQGWSETRTQSAGHRYRYDVVNKNAPNHSHFFILALTAEHQGDITNVTIRFEYAGPGPFFPSDYMFPAGYNPSPSPAVAPPLTPTP